MATQLLYSMEQIQGQLHMCLEQPLTLSSRTRYKKSLIARGAILVRYNSGHGWLCSAGLRALRRCHVFRIRVCDVFAKHGFAVQSSEHCAVPRIRHTTIFAAQRPREEVRSIPAAEMFREGRRAADGEFTLCNFSTDHLGASGACTEYSWGYTICSKTQNMLKVCQHCLEKAKSALAEEGTLHEI